MRSTIRIAVTGLAAACCLALAACGTAGTASPGGPAGGVLARAAGPGSPAPGLTWALKVQPGVTITEIEDAFASVAAEDNIRAVGELPLSKELELRAGKPGKFLKVYSYCDPAAARTMVDFNPSMAALLPCRISVVEQDDGLWIYTMDMDMLINMQGELPPHVGATVQRVRATILKMLDRGARGEF
ncbi:hypothetical protein ASD15_13600 [Massilia sp. Root351]|jgi:uncharacterized protein (DUF302 family)|uniref:DUF302 domain-containing protein n=1 Tax=Massilia sp. Root351 TaxID=1736522 RepID=UPI00070C4BEF|nr:DUF302 domain-containing protein [Massilia sp. Root351]KQV80918.1 hypothetical protein ASD15_13600 [Massilia sp. Root351]